MFHYALKSKSILLLTLLALLCLASCGSNFSATSTPQKQSNNIPIGTGNTAEPGNDSKPMPAPGGHTETILAAEGGVYVGSDNGQVYALDAQSGKIRWQQKLSATWLKALVGGVIYTTDERSNDGNVIYALNAANGEVIWQKEIKPFINRVKVVDDVVYITTGNAAFPVIIYALDASNGDQLWQYMTNSPDLLDVSNGRVYTAPSQDQPGATSAPQTITALSASSGHVLWHLPITLADGLVQGVTEANGIAYLSTNQGAVYAVQPTRGQLVWHTAQAPSGFPGKSFLLSKVDPTVSNGIVYAANAQSVFAYQASDGKLLWHYTAGNRPGPPIGLQPIVGNGVVYIAPEPPEGTLVALNATTGVVIWQDSGVGVDPDSLALVGDLLINQIGDVTVWRTSNGSKVWDYNTNDGSGPPGPGSHILIDNGALYIGSQSGIVRALRASDGKQLWQFAIPELAVQQLPVYSAWVTFADSTSYEQALQIVSDLGLKTFTLCKSEWVPEDGHDIFSSSHILALAATPNSAPLWLDRLRARPEVTQVQPEGPHSCTMDRSGPIQRLSENEAGAYLKVTFSSNAAYAQDWESLNALGFRLADPCYEQARAAGHKPNWHIMSQQGSFGSTHTFILATTIFNATIWQQQVRSVQGVTQVVIGQGVSCS